MPRVWNIESQMQLRCLSCFDKKMFPQFWMKAKKSVETDWTSLFEDNVFFGSLSLSTIPGV